LGRGLGIEIKGHKTKRPHLNPPLRGEEILRSPIKGEETGERIRGIEWGSIKREY